MRRLLLISILFAVSGAALAQSLRVVNGASLSSVSLAPGSIFTVFGANLAAGLAGADSAKTPPTQLGGVSVTIGGSAAALFYVSPTQINGVVNPATPTGAQTLMVRSTTGTQSTTVTISNNAPPGLFSLFGSGTRDGAILNAITFLLGAFSTTTAASPTYLALFATGLSASAAPAVTIGGVPVQVVFFGSAPCCDGLEQINVMLPASLDGAGRVPVVMTANGATSNTVQVVLLPAAGQGEFPGDRDNTSRSRELASLAYVPGTSLVLVTDENDDVVRVVDVAARQVTHVVALTRGSQPEAIAVTANGSTAVVAEAGSGKAAIIDLAKFTVTTEIATGGGATRVAIGGTLAVVVNQDNDTISIIDLTSNTVRKTLAVGRGPAGIAVDAAALKAYVSNEDDGTISVVALTALQVTGTVSLGASVRPESVALVPGAGILFITVPGAGPDGEVIELNLTLGMQTIVKANPDRSGGASDVIFFNSKLYFANQTGGSVSILPLSGTSSGSISVVKVDTGARALAIDVKDNLLVVSNEGAGTLVLVDLGSDKVTGRINAVQTNQEGDDGRDDHSDRNSPANQPSIQVVSPATGKAGSTFTLSVGGTNLAGATSVILVNTSGHGNANFNKGDSAFTVTHIAISSNGGLLTATVSIAASAGTGPRLVRVTTAHGESSGVVSAANTFTVVP